MSTARADESRLVPAAADTATPGVTAPAWTVLSRAAFEFRFNADSSRDTEHGGMASIGKTHLKRSLRNGPPVSLEPTPTGLGQRRHHTRPRLPPSAGSSLLPVMITGNKISPGFFTRHHRYLVIQYLPGGIGIPAALRRHSLRIDIISQVDQHIAGIIPVHMLLQPVTDRVMAAPELSSVPYQEHPLYHPVAWKRLYRVIVRPGLYRVITR